MGNTVTLSLERYHELINIEDGLLKGNVMVRSTTHGLYGGHRTTQFFMKEDEAMRESIKTCEVLEEEIEKAEAEIYLLKKDLRQANSNNIFKRIFCNG